MFQQACADKLRIEMETFGYPPVFPEIEEEKPAEPAEKKSAIEDKSKGKKVDSIY